MDLVPQFNDLLRQKESAALKPYVYRVQDVDAFLQEAYTINKRISELTQYLRSIRQSYLSAQLPPRRKQVTRTHSNTSSQPHQDSDRKYLTDAQRSEIDADAKKLIRELNFAVGNLAETEQLRQSAESNKALGKRAKQGLGALGRWAAGGAITAKSVEELELEEKAKTIKMHRESVIWYLQRKLEEGGRIQSEMMEIRITREVEKSKSALYKARGAMSLPDNFSVNKEANGFGGTIERSSNISSSNAALDEGERREIEEQLSSEQLQLFAQENQDMLKHYEDTLDQVRTAERSLLEISELQSTIASNLAIQQAHVDQLVQDSFTTEENVGKGNKELKRATERKSTARMIFYSTSVFCLTLIVWDLLI